MFLGVNATFAASRSDCLDVTFDNGDSICVAMKKNGSTYDVSLSSSNLGTQGTNVLMCEMETPDGTLRTL